MISCLRVRCRQIYSMIAWILTTSKGVTAHQNYLLYLNSGGFRICKIKTYQCYSNESKYSTSNSNIFQCVFRFCWATVNLFVVSSWHISQHILFNTAISTKLNASFVFFSPRLRNSIVLNFIGGNIVGITFNSLIGII